MEETVLRLKVEVDKKYGSLIALENDLSMMEAVVREFIRKYKQSQKKEEIEDEERVIRKPANNLEYEDSPPYILVFHGLEQDWMEKVGCTTRQGSPFDCRLFTAEAPPIGKSTPSVIAVTFEPLMGF